VIELLLSGAVILLVDQWTKTMVRELAPDRVISWGPALRIRPVRTSRQLYKSERGQLLLVLVWLMALGAAIILHRSGKTIHTQLALVGAGGALGGAAGNLIDILRRRAVLDFIDLGWWPVFNVADVAIVGGLVLALWPRS
jgi:signal peptidase II